MTALHAHPRDTARHPRGLHWVTAHHETQPHRVRWRWQRGRALAGAALTLVGVLVMLAFHAGGCSSGSDALCDASTPTPAAGIGVALVVIGVLLVRSAVRVRR